MGILHGGQVLIMKSARMNTPFRPEMSLARRTVAQGKHSRQIRNVTKPVDIR